MAENFSPQAEKVILRIATSKNPFKKLERLLEMDPQGEVLRRQENGKVAIASREAMERILMMIHSPKSGRASAETPHQPDHSEDKDSEPKDLP